MIFSYWRCLGQRFDSIISLDIPESSSTASGSNMELFACSIAEMKSAKYCSGCDKFISSRIRKNRRFLN